MNPIEKIKQERINAQRNFTKRVNKIIDAAEQMKREEFLEARDGLIKANTEHYDRATDLIDALEDKDPEGEANSEEIQQIRTKLQQVKDKYEECCNVLNQEVWNRFLGTEVEEATTRLAGALNRANPDGFHDLEVDSSLTQTLISEIEARIEGCQAIKDKWGSVMSQASLDDLGKAISSGHKKRDEYVFGLQRKITKIKTEHLVHGQPAAAGGGEPRAPAKVTLQPMQLPTFCGNQMMYYRWKDTWEKRYALQQQDVLSPEMNANLRREHLLSSIDKKIQDDLRLDYCKSANGIFLKLDSHYGNVGQIAKKIIMDLEKIPTVRNGQPKETLNLVQAIERAAMDLTALKCVGAINNPFVIHNLESKLPPEMQQRWLLHCHKSDSEVDVQNKFEPFMEFLQEQTTMLVALEQLHETTKSSGPKQTDPKPRGNGRNKSGGGAREKHSSTHATFNGGSRRSCVLCSGDHALFLCEKFKQATTAEKREHVRKHKACVKCLLFHEGKCKNNRLGDFLCKKRECKKEHNYLLCPIPKHPVSDVNSNPSNDSGRGAKESQGLPREIEEKLKKANLTPEELDVVRASTNNTTKSCSKENKHGSSTLLMTLEVTTKQGDRLGALIDLASDTSYITHKAAERIGVKGDPITLYMKGAGGMKIKHQTKKYPISLKVMKEGSSVPQSYDLLCYGLPEISEVNRPISPERISKLFPGVKPEEVIRPSEIEILISATEGRLAPTRVARCGELCLWAGPLGKTVSGVHPSLCDANERLTGRAATHLTLTMNTKAFPVREAETFHTDNAALAWWRWDSIGAACDPLCGGCRCGKCAPGGKEMSLADERELEIIKKGLTYKLSDEHSNEPHWDASYPWKEDPSTLPNNRKAVEATFLKAEKRLDRNPEWKEVYTSQMHEMLKRGAAIKLSETALEMWSGAVWWINHLAAPNPHSVSTPVRIVWDSSQQYLGTSLNSMLLKGPDVLNPIRAVLLRFREGEYAAIGDVSKMYHSVWLEEREVHLHRFLWRDSANDPIEDYAVVRVNMGDRPAGCIAQVAMRETAYLPKFTHMVEERDVIVENAYVDDLFSSHNCPQRLEQVLTGVKTILAAGGFHLKPWVRSGQSGKDENGETKPETMLLPNQMREEDNKALGVGYHVKEDSLFAMVAINFSVRKKKMRTEKNLTVEEVADKTPNPLTRRMLLSQVAGLYDPIGLVTPQKQKGVILVRRAFQEAGSLTKDTWDQPLSNDLRMRAVELFKEYARLSSVTFPRCITPPGWVGKPWGITLSDGSSESYGAVLYLRWETATGVETRLVESKAKLTPLDQKGDAVKAEICGAVFAARLKQYVQKHSRLKIEKWFHFVDSQTVLGAIQRDSYGFQTFFANRIGEIQKAGPVTDWWWIPGAENIADLVTRGGSPEQLDRNSPWQKGPEFLARPIEEWPMKSAAEVAASTREIVSTLQRKAFSAVTTRSQTRNRGSSPLPSSGRSSPVDRGSPPVDVGSAPVSDGGAVPVPTEKKEQLWGSGLVDQLDLTRSSTLSKLCGTVGYVRRVMHGYKGLFTPGSRAKWEGILSVEEREIAFKELCLAAQEKSSFPTTTLNRLVVSKDDKTGLLLCRGRVQSVDNESRGVPIIPYEARLSTLLCEEAHRTNHEGVAGTLLRVRRKAWVIKGSKVARKVVNSCLHCRKRAAKLSTQVMADLPAVRTSPAAPFEYTTLDLFGPYTVRGSVQRRIKRKVWGVVFSCMASRAIHADLVEDLSTEGFLQTYQRFTALRGHPRKLWSDQGTNFVGARPALEELYKFLRDIDKEQIQQKAAVTGTDWTWEFSPADSPHRNGAAEAAVRVLKRALSSVGEAGDLSALEFQTLLYLAANLTNERPIGARVQVHEDSVDIITPNSLLLGRAGSRGDFLDFDFPSYPYSRLRAVQREVDKFWKRWSQLAGPHLFIREKWHVPARNVAVGDLVWVADQNALRGRFRMGRVVEAIPDTQGVVRDVKVQTCPSLPLSWPQVKKGQVAWPSVILHRDVRRLVVLIPIEDQ